MADPATVAKAAAKAAQVIGRLAGARRKRQQDDGGGGAGAGFALLAALVVLVPAALVLGGVLMISTLAGAQQQGCGGEGVGSVSGKGIPAKLIPIYQAAARQYHLGPFGPAVLASINGIESDFGRDPSTSSAGAQGWMQFEPDTWAAYGVDANHDGRKDPQDPVDAIFAAANYLHALGAPRNWHAAVFGYDHAEWYVSAVLNRAQEYAKAGTGPGSPITAAGGAVPTQDLTGTPGSNCANAAAPGSYAPLPQGSLTPAQLKQVNGVTDIHWSGGPLATWIAYLYQYARRYGWDGAHGQTSLSGFRTHAQHQSICCGRGGFGNRTSHHEGTKWPSGAIDIEDSTSRARFNLIIARSPYRGMIYNSGAPPPCGGSYCAGFDSVHSSSGIYANGTSF